jgi:hypothetical protein
MVEQLPPIQIRYYVTILNWSNGRLMRPFGIRCLRNTKSIRCFGRRSMNSCGGSLWIRGIGKRSTQERMRAFTLSGKVFSSYLYRHAFASILSWPSIFPSAGIFGHGQLRRAAPRIGTTFDSADSAARIPGSRAFHSPVASPPRRCEGLRLCTCRCCERS